METQESPNVLRYVMTIFADVAGSTQPARDPVRLAQLHSLDGRQPAPAERSADPGGVLSTGQETSRIPIIPWSSCSGIWQW